MSDTYRRQSGPQPASTADLLAHLKSSLGSNSKSPRTYAALAAGKVPAGQARPGKGADQRARNSAFFNRRDSPSPDLPAKVASLLRQSDTTQSSRVPQLISGQSRAATPLSSNRSTPEECFGSDNGHQSSAAGWASEASFTRPASVTPSGKSAARGLGIKRSATTPEPHSAPFSLPSLCQPNTSAGSRPWQTADSREPKPAWRQGHREPGTPAPTQTDPSAVSAAAADAATPPAWSEELLNWMLAEKAELLLEVQRLQRRQAEVQQELDRARARAAGPGLEQEVQRLKAERRVLLEKLQHLAQQDAESSALLERARMENDALTTELERSQEVCKEMLAARRAARDALSEMSAQNARLVSAYVEKKQEAAALREDLRRQQCDAEARIRTLAEELHTTQIQCLTLKEQLCSHIHLPATCHTEQGHHSPSRQSSRTEGLPEPSPACRTSSTLDEEISGVDFASAFASPVRQRAPPAPHQQQNGKENAMWSGNRGAINSSGRGKKPLAQQGHEAGQAPVAAMPAGEPAMATKQGKGDWDKERSELLSLLERLQHQLSANAEQQAATPAKQPANAREASWQGQQQDGVRQPLQAHKIPQDLEQESSPSFAAAFGLQSPSMQQPSPKRNASAQDISSPFPPPNEESSPAMTPLSHSSAASSGPTPRHSHFSVPRYSASCSEPLSRVGMYSEQESRVYSSAGSSRRSTQAATPHSRRSSGINLSKVFEGAASNRANSRASTPGSDASESCAVPEAAYYAAHTSGAARPDSAGLCSEPSSASDDGDAGMSTPHAGMTGSPAAAYQPTPIIPPMATPFAAQPREETCCELGGRMGTAQQCAQQHPSLRQHQQPENSELRPVGINSMEEHPVVEGQGTPEEQRLAAAEERNAVLEAEVQHLRQLQHEAEEQARQDEQRRQIDQHKQAGNAAFQQHRYEQAVLEYAAGLEICSAAKNAAASAVLFCNRAAALHAMGRYLEAVADCFRAEQQDASYARLYHRRADAYCTVGAYDAASQDLAQLVQMGCGREVQARLQEVQHKLKAQYPVNHYAVLGVKSSANLAEIKTAYRALALKFHPDKAGQGLPHAAADAIFKLVTAANATLSDAEKRRAHDLQCLRHKYRRFYSYHF